jgi:hypothetical protein
MLQLCATVLNVTWFATQKMNGLLRDGWLEKSAGFWMRGLFLCGT